MDAKQFRKAISNILHEIDEVIPYSKAAEDLLFGTGAVESQCGQYIWQIRGPALSPFQIEPATMRDLRLNWMAYSNNRKYRCLLHDYAPPGMTDEEALWGCLAFSIVVCRLIYWRRPEPLPKGLAALGRYWKTHYNTHLGAGTAQGFVEAYQRHNR